LIKKLGNPLEREAVQEHEMFPLEKEKIKHKARMSFPD
jgi:hypothetical protein